MRAKYFDLAIAISFSSEPQRKFLQYQTIVGTIIITSISNLDGSVVIAEEDSSSRMESVGFGRGGSFGEDVGSRVTSNEQVERKQFEEAHSEFRVQGLPSSNPFKEIGKSPVPNKVLSRSAYSSML